MGSVFTALLEAGGQSLKRFKDDALATLARMAMSDGLAHSDIFAVAHART